jgi:type VI secretion system protein ImpL
MNLPDWTIRDAPRGRAAEGVLIRASGEDVFAPIPALYTYRGYWEGARGLFDAAVDEALAEKWVLASREDAADPTAIERREAETRIRDLYATDYAAAWQTFLDDLRIAPFADAGQAAQILRVLSSLDSPLRNVLTEAARQTHLDRPPETATGQAGGVLDTARAAGVANRATSAATRLERAAGAAGGDSGPTVAERVSETFAPLRDFVGSAEQGSPLAELINRLAELREVVSAIEGRRASLDDLVGNPVVASVQNTADAGPPFLRRMASEMAQTFETTVAGGLRASLNERWRAEVAPFCQQRLAGRYPFGGGEDAALGDVAEVLGPGGLIDAFFRQNMAGMVDTQALEWRWKDLGLALGIPVETLRFFQTAAELREAFFPGGAQVPGFAFGVRPEAFDPEVSAMSLAVGGEERPFLRDDPAPAQLAWPGPIPDQGAVVTMQVLGGGRDISGAPLPATEAEQAQIGPWGLFRLLDRSGFGRLGSGERVRVRLRAGGRSVTAILSMSSPENPLALRREMGAFRCPASL